MAYHAEKLPNQLALLPDLRERHKLQQQNQQVPRQLPAHRFGFRSRSYSLAIVNYPQFCFSYQLLESKH
jgi:hypothetical protein